MSITLTLLLEKKRRDEERERRKREGLPEFTEAELAEAESLIRFLDAVLSWKTLVVLAALAVCGAPQQCSPCNDG